MSVPLIFTVPKVGLSTPPSKCNSVDFPLPLAPIIATNSPSFTEKEILSTAVTLLSPFP